MGKEKEEEGEREAEKRIKRDGRKGRRRWELGEMAIGK
jgi:hypothetical protein